MEAATGEHHNYILTKNGMNQTFNFNFRYWENDPMKREPPCIEEAKRENYEFIFDSCFAEMTETCFKHLENRNRMLQLIIHLVLR